MKKLKGFLVLLVLVLAGFSVAQAEDTDIYVDNTGPGAVPNILLVIDSAAAFDASASACSYASGGSPVTNGKAMSVEQCALVDAIESLSNGAINLGIMITNGSGVATDVRSTTDPAYHRTCSGTAGGCLVRELTLMDAAGKASLVNFIKSWTLSAGQNSATEFNPKASTSHTGGMMQEAWAYYNGKTGQSGTTYPTSIIQSGCQKNFVVFIGNAYGNSGTPGDGTVSPYSDAYGLTSADVGATAGQKLKITDTVNFNPATCSNTTSMPARTNTSDWSENWADEWARLMYQVDGGTPTQETTQNIITYTIGVTDPALGNSCKPDYPALLSSMATFGGGKYFPSGNAAELLKALETILNEVQAVNSVFSSASLPVSVNAEGTFLNQIYLGMFRPDVTGSPRWLGNLKQYQAIKTATGDLAMGDATGKPAISSAGTGFISPNAISFWTKKDTTQAPDAAGGFYRNDLKGVPPSGYDLPDGEVVEKGGVAQQLRLESLTASFGSTGNNPRRLYTYCPSGTGCNALLTDSANAFSIANTGIASTAFGSSDRDTMIKWVRGEDNATATVTGAEKGPGGSVTVRPSVHGDVLHSRPVVVNYGDSRGIVVFYGSNDGVFRAVNGNQTAAIGSVPAGGELWGLVLPEHYGKLTRQRLAFPELRFPSTTLDSALPKDYFVDGPAGAFQRLAADGTIDKSYLYLTMRRGGRFLYALDVSTPTAPKVLWKIDTTKAGFEELGQTWSRPRVTLLERSLAGTPTPVLIFGAGYDPAEDAEPPVAGTMGRGIYIVDALTGDLIWRANSTCTTSPTCRNVPLMNYAIPSEIAFVDRNGNGYTDKLYFGDMGGNIWRADVNGSNTADWTVTRLAALGCATGACAAGTTPRKFFFPPSVLTIKEGAGSYDAVSTVSGDREHPLKSTATGSSFNVNDRFFMVLDRGTTVGATVTANVTPDTLFNATSAEYDSTLNGFYINLATGEKAVNAPIAINGFIFFATNRPVDRTATCAANLGEAKAYAVSPFLGTRTSNILAGGGLAPSAVTGLITVGNTTQKFCIGCGVSTLPDPPSGTPAPPCNSALEICTPHSTIPKNMRRSYWYKK